MNWLRGILYGFVSGISEFLPISAQAHERIFLFFFGQTERDPVMALVIHIAALLALLTGARVQLEQIRRERTLKKRSRRQATNPTFNSLADLRFVKNASWPMACCILLLRYIVKVRLSMPVIAIMLLLNGIALFLPSRMISGNKNAGKMSLFDSILVGLCGAACVVPGLSGIGLVIAATLIRGADRKHVKNWVVLLMIPSLGIQILTDIIDIFAGIGNPAGFGGFFAYLLAVVFAYVAARVAIYLLGRMLQNNTVSFFAYYSWGAALFAFLLYLSVA